MFKRDFLVKSNFNIKQALNYNKAYDKIIELNLFDENFYSENYSQFFTGDALKHYLFEGYKKNFDPSAKFSTKEYINKNPDVKKSNLNPLVHYVLFGKNEGKKIYPSKLIKKEKISNRNLLCLHNYKFKNEPLVSIIVLNRNGINHLKVLFKDFSKKTNYSNFEFILVDNDSNDNSVSYAKSLNVDFPLKIIENNENLSFSEANNQACEIANGEYLLLLNNDIEPTYGWLNEMMGTIIYNDNVASVGAKLIFPYIDDLKNTNKSFSIQHAGDILRQAIDDVCIYKGHNQNKFSKDIFDSQISVNKKRLLVTGAVLLIKKIVYDELGGLDESYWYGYEDIDFNLRVHNAGYDTMFASAALLFHHESATRKTVNRNNHKVFCKKWSKYLFKKLLFDKIEKNYFFTDETLNILLVADSDFNQFKDSVHNLSSFCANNEYIVNVSFDPDDLKIHHTVDIIISFTESFDIKNIHARTNVVKVLITKNQIGSDDLGYDIVLNESNELGEKLISGLYDKYSDF